MTTLLSSDASESILDWDFVGENTQYSTHGLHTYLAAMIPQVPRRLIQLYARENTKILDPFVGGGSVTTEAYLAGHKATGIDVNSLAVLISQVKSMPISDISLEHISRNFSEVFNDVTVEIPTFTSRSNVDYWFKDYMYKPLSKIRTSIDQISLQVVQTEQNNVLRFLKCVYSNTVRSVSLTYRSEIRLRRLKERDYEIFNPNVYELFELRLNDAIERIRQLPNHDTLITLLEGDARALPFEDDSYDLIITSPPYGDNRNTVPYDQFSKNMLYWLGYNDSDIDRIRRHSLGFRSASKVLPKSATLACAVNLMSKPRAHHDARSFYHDYYQALKEMARVASERIVIVIGHRILNDVFVDNAQITTELLEVLGWSLDEKYERRIPGKRIHKKMAFGRNSKGATIDRESILVYVPK